MLARSSHIVKNKIVFTYTQKAMYFTKWFVRPGYNSTEFYGSSANKNGLFVLNNRFMSVKKVVFKSEPEMEPNIDKVEEPTLSKLASQSNEQSSQQKSPVFQSIEQAEKYYESEQKVIFEKQREKWIHNITKSFNENFYQDSIENSKKFSGLEKHEWFEKEKSKIQSSADPYASLISKVIQNSVDNQSADPMTVDEINNFPVGDVLQRIQKYQNKAAALENEHYVAVRKKAIRHI